MYVHICTETTQKAISSQAKIDSMKIPWSMTSVELDVDWFQNSRNSLKVISIPSRINFARSLALAWHPLPQELKELARDCLGASDAFSVDSLSFGLHHFPSACLSLLLQFRGPCLDSESMDSVLELSKTISSQRVSKESSFWCITWNCFGIMVQLWEKAFPPLETVAHERTHPSTGDCGGCSLANFLY